MRKTIVVAAVLVLAGCAGPAEFPEPAGSLDVDLLDGSLIINGVISGHYIVTVREGSDPVEVAWRYSLPTTFAYRTGFTGFAAWAGEHQLRALQDDPDVEVVEADGIAQVNAETVPYGIRNVGADVSSVRAGDGTGSVNGPTIFSIDTGVETTHPDLNVIGFVNYAGGPAKDCNGHGTHTMGTAAARDTGSGVVGVAPGAKIHAVKVLSCSGSGSWSGVIAGMDFVSGSSAAQKVANLSLGGGYNASVNQAAARMVTSNVAVAVAAGNEGDNAANHSPASEPSVLTVAAHDQNNVNASWSNFGSLVDVSAPGVAVYSTYKRGGYATYSGTSMASPHAAGALAIYRNNNPSASGAQAIAAVKANTSGTSSRGFGRVWVGSW